MRFIARILLALGLAVGSVGPALYLGVVYPQGTLPNATFGQVTPCNEGVAQFSTTDTLNNSVTTEQVFATKCTIAANYLVANKTIKATLAFDSTPTTTVPSYTFKAKLCTVSGCGSGTVVNVVVSPTVAVASQTISNSVQEVLIQGTAAAGASVSVEGSYVPGLWGKTFIGQNTQAGSVAGVPTNGALFLQFSITFSGTGTNNPVTLAQLIVQALN